MTSKDQTKQSHRRKTGIDVIYDSVSDILLLPVFHDLSCDFPWIDDFAIQYCQRLGKRGFTVKSWSLSRKKFGKREYLNDADTRGLMRAQPVLREHGRDTENQSREESDHRDPDQ